MGKEGRERYDNYVNMDDYSSYSLSMSSPPVAAAGGGGAPAVSDGGVSSFT